ncbi:hypothetical protein FJT64_011649 [Amphibalanus amphitrite]|uniref:Peptidase A2 domain-containing protein n=1 Tax=Amphibalanus amphitrite TaxID=1232801 RepID=A0A6A4VI59_AMPAM|nr:hypothetical protein FJT64_011649 [Amphibalanus amphitrite]
MRSQTLAGPSYPTFPYSYTPHVAEQVQRAAAAKAELARRQAEAQAEQARQQAEQSRRQAEQAEAQAALQAQAAMDEAEYRQLELELLEQEERGSQHPRSSAAPSVARLPVVATEPPAPVDVSRQTDESVTRTRQWLAQSQLHVPPVDTAPVGTLPPPAVRLQHPSRDDTRAVPHLPRITLEKFGGSAIEWPRWIALFKALVHDRADLTDVERLTYLQTHLTGPARESVRGMLCDASLYSTALGELEREFGDPSRVIHATMKRLLTARPVKDGDLSALTELSRSRTTNALLDLGSQVTLVTDGLCDRLGISGPAGKLLLSTLNGNQTMQSRRVSFAVEAVGGDGKAHCIQNAQTTPTLNVSAKVMDCTVAKEEWPHLADLDLPSATRDPVEVLLGTDAIELIVPREEPAKEQCITAANGTELHVYGLYRASVRLEDQVERHAFFVTDVRQGVMGMDLLQKFGALIDVQHREVRPAASRMVPSSGGSEQQQFRDRQTEGGVAPSSGGSEQQQFRDRQTEGGVALQHVGLLTAAAPAGFEPELVSDEELGSFAQIAMIGAEDLMKMASDRGDFEALQRRVVELEARVAAL